MAVTITVLAIFLVCVLARMNAADADLRACVERYARACFYTHDGRLQPVPDDLGEEPSSS